MKKSIYLFMFLLFSTALVAKGKGEQDKLVSANLLFMTDSQMFGINVQTMFPIGSNFYIAPEFTYFFPKSDSFSFSEYYYKVTQQAINISADFHYPIYVGKRSFISPLLGLGGYVAFVDQSGTEFNGSASGSMFLANMGIAGKFSITNKLFFNTQIKYLRPLQEGSGAFTFSAGLGLYF